MRLRFAPMRITIGTGLLIAFVVGCGPGPRHGDDDIGGDGNSCLQACSPDLHAIVDCHGNTVTDCQNGTACDPSTYTCQDACSAAEANHRSVGCDYYATQMDAMTSGYCYAVFVANTWTMPAKISVEYMGASLP